MPSLKLYWMTSGHKEIQYEIDIGDCWNCTSHASHTGGYVQLNREGKKGFMHRHIYDHFFYDPPEGQVVMHICDNPKCINPLHLMLGTHKENMADMIEKGRCKRAGGEDHYLSKLAEKQVVDIIKNKGSQPIKEVAKDYGVTYATIHSIYKGKSWKHLSNPFRKK